MARQSYFDVKSSSFTSSILKTVFRQVSSLLGLKGSRLLSVLAAQLQTVWEGRGLL